MKRNQSTLGEFLIDLRSSLVGINGFSSTLLDGTDDDVYDKEERKEFLGIVVSECRRLQGQLDALLGTSRIGTGPWLGPVYSRFDLIMVLKEHVRIQERASDSHTVSLEVHDRFPETIVADQDRVHQILMNLLNNAIKYSPNGGEITVHARVEGDDILVGVQDRGIGIPKEDLGKVFEKFYRVDNDDNRKSYGTGLGLFLVRDLVERFHLGEIWAESEVGVGSTFWFRMPKELDVERAAALIDW